MKNSIIAVLIIIIGIYSFIQEKQPSQSSAKSTSSNQSAQSVQNKQTISNAYKKHLSDLQVSGSGTVAHILRDDTKGIRHQKFILQISPKQTILIAHNIDLSPRIKGLKKGDKLSFYGEYEWSEKGGVVHWTHHDPGGRHIDGWLKHKGKTYQ